MALVGSQKLEREMQRTSHGVGMRADSHTNTREGDSQMAGYNSNNNRGGNYRPPQAAQPRSSTTGSSSAAPKSDALFSRFLRPSKSGKSLATFSVGDTDLVLPANTRVVITELSQKRKDALAKVAIEKGFKGVAPTHELTVFPITEKK